MAPQVALGPLEGQKLEFNHRKLGDTLCTGEITNLYHYAIVIHSP